MNQTLLVLEPARDNEHRLQVNHQTFSLKERRPDDGIPGALNFLREQVSNAPGTSENLEILAHIDPQAR